MPRRDLGGNYALERQAGVSSLCCALLRTGWNWFSKPFPETLSLDPSRTANPIYCPEIIGPSNRLTTTALEDNSNAPQTPSAGAGDASSAKSPQQSLWKSSNSDSFNTASGNGLMP